MYADIKLLSDLTANINGGRITINGQVLPSFGDDITKEQYNRRSNVLDAARILEVAIEDCAKAYNVV